MRRLRPAISLRAGASPRHDTEPTFEAFARLVAATGPWMFWFGLPSFPTAHDRDPRGSLMSALRSTGE
jgi:hypothetical protein